MENDRDLRRKYRYALNTIWIFAFLVLGASIWGVIGQANSWSYEHQFKVFNAEVATGPCGDKQIVVVDENRVAIAGRIFQPDMASTLRFEGGPDNLRVLSENGQLLMERKRR